MMSYGFIWFLSSLGNQMAQIVEILNFEILGPTWLFYIFNTMPQLMLSNSELDLEKPLKWTNCGLMMPYGSRDLSRPNDAIWQQRSESILHQAVTWSNVDFSSMGCNFTGSAKDINLWNNFEKYTFSWANELRNFHSKKYAKQWYFFLPRPLESLLQTWVSKYIYYKVWSEITYLSPNFLDAATEVWGWVRHFISLFTGHVFTYSCSDLSQSLCKRGPP